MSFMRYRIWHHLDGVINTLLVYGPGIKDKNDAIAFFKTVYPDAEVGQVELAGRKEG